MGELSRRFKQKLADKERAKQASGGRSIESSRYTPLSRRTLALAAMTGLFLAVSNGVRQGENAHAEEAPAQDSPAGLVIHNILQNRTDQGDPYVEQRVLLGYDSFSEIGENMLSQVQPQGFKQLKVQLTGDRAKFGIVNTDSESAFISPSQVSAPDVNGQSVPVPYIDQIDNDIFLHNQRSVQIFKVSRIADWAQRSRWRKVTPKVAFDEWTETDINAPIPTGEIRNPFIAFKSPLTQEVVAESKLSTPISKKDIALGLVAIRLTKTWGQRNDADGYRQGYSRVLYRFPKRNSQPITPSSKFFAYNSREVIRFEYSNRPPEKNSVKTLSPQVAKAAAAAKRKK